MRGKSFGCQPSEMHAKTHGHRFLPTRARAVCGMQSGRQYTASPMQCVPVTCERSPQPPAALLGFRKKSWHGSSQEKRKERKKE